MQRARALDDSRQPDPDRGAERSALRSTPLTLVAGAVAGDTLQSVAGRVADALGCPVAIAIPAHGVPVVCPPGSLSDEAAAAIAAHAAVIVGVGDDAQAAAAPGPIADAVPVRIGDQVVGIVAAGAGGAPAERRAWLEAAAAAASVTALIREAPGQDSGEALVAELAAGPTEDLPGVLARARRLGVDLSLGAAALSGRAGSAIGLPEAGEAILAAELRPGRLIALCPPGEDELAALAELAARLRAAGMQAAVSAPRRDPALLHEAIREAELLAELTDAEQDRPGPHDETYRLLIGVLLRDPAELAQLRDSTVAPLADYDRRHDTDLLDTLQAFLGHDGSTTDTADALALHRHTVGYRLARVHEVSGLSPYESDGRERLGLGLKAHRILEVERRLD
ncbi:MAG TPA: helix-turn-helix domain-containing protein [Solirubrobacteraceae bacterium]|nr:helix-turn-helix domain-containing protein [Solirubrobacteraceae bacterium]